MQGFVFCVRVNCFSNHSFIRSDVPCMVSAGQVSILVVYSQSHGGWGPVSFRARAARNSLRQSFVAAVMSSASESACWMSISRIGVTPRLRMERRMRLRSIRIPRPRLGAISSLATSRRALCCPERLNCHKGVLGVVSRSLFAVLKHSHNFCC